MFVQWPPERFRDRPSRKPPSKIPVMELAQQDHVASVSRTHCGSHVNVVCVHDLTPRLRSFHIASYRCEFVRRSLAQADLTMSCVLIALQILDLLRLQFGFWLDLDAPSAGADARLLRPPLLGEPAGLLGIGPGFGTLCSGFGTKGE